MLTTSHKNPFYDTFRCSWQVSRQINPCCVSFFSLFQLQFLLSLFIYLFNCPKGMTSTWSTCSPWSKKTARCPKATHCLFHPWSLQDGLMQRAGILSNENTNVSDFHTTWSCRIIFFFNHHSALCDTQKNIHNYMYIIFLFIT